jgi:hypothetical protein
MRLVFLRYDSSYYDGKCARCNGVTSQKRTGFGSGVCFQKMFSLLLASEALILYCFPK